MAYIHQMCIVWRDPKPANVVVTPEGRVVILDFGISRQLSLAGADTQVGMILGTPGYMSPEQIRGEPVDTRSDIYGLGSCTSKSSRADAPTRALTFQKSFGRLALCPRRCRQR